VEISAIVPKFNNATASLEERLAGVDRFENVDALIAEGKFDGAIVCLPNNEAPQAVTKLALAGKHVLVKNLPLVQRKMQIL